MTTDLRTVRQPRFLAAAQFARTLAVGGVLAGSVSGAFVGGLGSRIAMRLSGALSDNCAELVTRSGFVCGEITVMGTVGLLLNGMLVGGVFGGLLYVATNPWLQWAGRWHGLMFGVLLLITLGGAEVLSPSPNFQIFATPSVNVVLYAMLFPLFGLAMPPTTRWVHRTLVAIPPRKPGRWHVWAGYFLIGVSSTLVVLAAGALALVLFASVVGAMGSSTPTVLFLCSFFYLLAFGWLLRTGALRRRLPLLRARLAVQVLVLAAPVGVGGVLTAMAIVEIVSY